MCFLRLAFIPATVTGEASLKQPGSWGEMASWDGAKSL